ncbi:hypothetical protein BDQ17DRAFT_1437116 [Cyathus striatus]|nr:hypothetical protein BDQ17DRAFT_1437116 [Cyathus striatus]
MLNPALSLYPSEYISYMYFWKEVEQITAATDNDLTEYQLTPTQWGIVKDLIDALEIFKDATDLFFRKKFH